MFVVLILFLLEWISQQEAIRTEKWVEVTGLGGKNELAQ